MSKRIVCDTCGMQQTPDYESPIGFRAGWIHVDRDSVTIFGRGVDEMVTNPDDLDFCGVLHAKEWLQATHREILK